MPSPTCFPTCATSATRVQRAGAEGRSRRRTVQLTLLYVLGLALVYATLGLIAGMTGTLFGTIVTARV